MLVNFGLLVWSSVLVLFYASVENIDLVVGAAAVLFIADVVSWPESVSWGFGFPRLRLLADFMLVLPILVRNKSTCIPLVCPCLFRICIVSIPQDEKAMLFKNVKPNLSFFWVLQCVGTSLVLALFAVKVTDNGSLISGDGMGAANNGTSTATSGTDSSDGMGWQTTLH